MWQLLIQLLLGLVDIHRCIFCDFVLSSILTLMILTSRRIVHMDIKGENIFLTLTDEPKIGDWGAARFAKLIKKRH